MAEPVVYQKSPIVQKVSRALIGGARAACRKASRFCDGTHRQLP
jgi:hypothetical protein